MTDEDDPLASVPQHDRPRERLRRIGPAALTDEELLALVLGTGRQGRNVLATSRAVLRQTGGFSGLAAMDVARLERLPGIGPAMAGRLAATPEIWRRAGTTSAWSRLIDDDAVARIVLPELAHRATERFVVVVADRAGRPLELVSMRDGGDSQVSVEPSEVLQTVLVRAGRSFAVAHNHPGGSLEPSVADTTITRRLSAAAATIGLRFLGHILVAGAEWRRL